MVISKVGNLKETVDDIHSFGYWVRRRRKALDLTQQVLADQVYCSLSTIKKIELDERRPSPLMAERLAECLDIQGVDRHAFIAAAGAEISFDRLNFPSLPLDRSTAHSNLEDYLSPTPFIGYRKELTELSGLISDGRCRLVSLVGAGGMGKTRLALRVAAGQVDRFPDGVYFIPLAQVGSLSSISSAILDALSLPHYPGSDLHSTLLEYLHTRNTLLVLDNYEHLLNTVSLVTELLRNSPRLVILVTSREPLDLTQECVYEVNGLPVEREAGAQVSSLDAVQLFLQAAQRVGGMANPTLQDLDTVWRICKLVEGMPLAIELAGAWARTHTYLEIEAGIMGSLDFLSSAKHDASERHRSIQAAFGFSWRLLTPEEQRLFPILSIFRGGFQVDAIQMIAGTQTATLDSLVNKSLLKRTSSGRYEMHELIRRYSEQKLVDLGLTDYFLILHLKYYLKRVENTSPGINSSAGEQLAAFYRSDIDNLRLALSTAIERNEVELGLRLVVALGQNWLNTGHLLEGLAWLRQLIRQENGQYPILKTQALILSASIYRDMGDFEQAISLSKQSLVLCKVVKDQALTGQSLMILGTSYYLVGEAERGSKLLERSLAIFQAADDESQQIRALLRIGDLERWRGMLDTADFHWQQALAIATRLGEKKEMGFSLGGLGDIKRLQGKYHEAMQIYKRALLIHWERNDVLDITFLFEAMALDFIALQQVREALVLWGAANKLRYEIHSLAPPRYQQSYATAIQAVRTQLGEATFTKAVQAGSNTPLEQVISSFLQPLSEANDQPTFHP